MKTVEFQDTLPFPEYLMQLRRYYLCKLLRPMLLTAILPALVFALVVMELLPLGYWACAGILYGILVAVPLWLFLYPQFRHYARRECNTYHPQRTWRLDYESQTLTVTTAFETVNIHFSLLTRLRRIDGFVWLERGNALCFCLRANAFPSPEALEEWVCFLREAIRNPRRPQLETLPPQLPRVSPWKGCLLGCGTLLLVMAILTGVRFYQTLRPWFFSQPVTEYRLTSEERTQLDAAVERLNRLLREKAPALMAQQRPLPDGMRTLLREQLGGVEVEPLEVWFDFSNGLTEAEIMPMAWPLDITVAVASYQFTNQAWVRAISPERFSCMMLLHDDAGDGYFLDLSGAPPQVCYDMQEVPDDVLYLGSMADFIDFLADGLEQEIWSFDADGRIQYDLQEFLDFQRRYVSP